MALSKESIKKLRAVKAAILAEPELYDQCKSPRGMTDCWTPCCIAGWAIWLEDPSRYIENIEGDVVEGMAKALKITFDQSEKLFAKWSEDDSPAWEEPMTREAALDGAKRIEHFIATDGRE